MTSFPAPVGKPWHTASPEIVARQPRWMQFFMLMTPTPSDFASNGWAQVDDSDQVLLRYAEMADPTPKERQ